jgi:hypothetical protein
VLTALQERQHGLVGVPALLTPTGLDRLPDPAQFAVFG